MTKIAVLGAGKIGEALLSGLLQGGRPAADLMFTEKHEARARSLAEQYGIEGTTVAGAAASADVLSSSSRKPRWVRTSKPTWASRLTPPRTRTRTPP